MLTKTTMISTNKHEDIIFSLASCTEVDSVCNYIFIHSLCIWESGCLIESAFALTDSESKPILYPNTVRCKFLLCIKIEANTFVLFFAIISCFCWYV